MRNSLVSWSKMDSLLMNAINEFTLNCLSYIDDMLILGTNIEVIKSTKRMLSNNFDMEDLGVADVI